MAVKIPAKIAKVLIRYPVCAGCFEELKLVKVTMEDGSLKEIRKAFSCPKCGMAYIATYKVSEIVQLSSREASGFWEVTQKSGKEDAK